MTSFLDLGLTNGRHTRYQVYAVDTNQNRSIPATIFVTPVSGVVPSRPSDSRRNRDAKDKTLYAIQLEWAANPVEDGVTEYQVFRHDAVEVFDWNNPLTRPPDADPLTTSFDDQPTEAGTPPFTYAVRALDGSDLSLPSNEARASLRSGSFQTPLAALPGDAEVKLRWNGLPTCVNGPCSFAVYRRFNIERDCKAYRRVGTVAFMALVPPQSYAFTDWGVTNAAAYEYTIAVVDANGIETDLSSPPASRDSPGEDHRRTAMSHR